MKFAFTGQIPRNGRYNRLSQSTAGHRPLQIRAKHLGFISSSLHQQSCVDRTLAKKINTSISSLIVQTRRKLPEL